MRPTTTTATSVAIMGSSSSTIEPRPLGPQYNLMSDSHVAVTVPIGITILTQLRLVSTLAAMGMVALLVYLLATGNLHMQYFTHWQLVFFTAFLWTLVVGLFGQRWALTLAVLVLLPFQTGLTIVVPVAITLLIKVNPLLLMSESTYEGGALSMGTINEGHWIYHGVPPIVLYMLLGWSGLWQVARAVVGGAWQRFETSRDRFLYTVGWMCVPLLALGLYDAALGFEAHYPTGLPALLLWLGLVAIVFLVQGNVLASLVLSDNVDLRVGDVPSLTRWLVRGWQRGVGGNVGGETVAVPLQSRSSSLSSTKEEEEVVLQQQQQHHQFGNPTSDAASLSFKF